MHKDYSFSTATLEDREEIEQLLVTYYLVDEPLNQAAGIRDIDFIPIMKPLVERCLETPFSYVARHRETNELAGVVLCSLWARGEDEDYYETTTRDDEVAAAHDAVTNELHASFWKLVAPDVQLVLHNEMSSVAIAHRRKGLALDLQRLCCDVDLMKSYKVDGIVSEASSTANQRLLEKLGFESLNHLNYADYLGADGRRLLEPNDGSTKIDLKWMPIERLE